MLDPVAGEGINNTDADIFEWEGNTYVFYGTGDQATWGTIRVAMYAGPMRELLEAYFPLAAARFASPADLRRVSLALNGAARAMARAVPTPPPAGTSRFRA